MQTSILPQHDPDFADPSIIELALRKADGEIGPIPSYAFWMFWGVVGFSNVVAGVAVGAMTAGLGGAIGGGGVALLGTLLSATIFIHLSAICGGAMSRTTAACAGAVAGMLTVNMLRPFDEWELRVATLAGAGSAALAASLCREYLCRAYGCKRWRLTTNGLLARTMLVALTAAFWTACLQN